MEKLVIHVAEKSDAQPSFLLLRDVAIWLQEKGEWLWPPSYFSQPMMQTHIDKKELIVGYVGETMATCMLMLDIDQEFWPEASDPAYYLHKIAVSRNFAGRAYSRSMINWAAERARAEGIDKLRIDCAPRPKLLNVYRKAGFEPVDSEPLSISGFLVVRMELNCRPKGN